MRTRDVPGFIFLIWLYADRHTVREVDAHLAIFVHRCSIDAGVEHLQRRCQLADDAYPDRHDLSAPRGHEGEISFDPSQQLLHDAAVRLIGAPA